MVRFALFARLAEIIKRARVTIEDFDPSINVYRLVPTNPNGRSVLLIHGSGGGAHNWPLWARPFLRRGYTLYLLDLPGHWGSGGDIDVGKVSIWHHVRVVRELIDSIVKIDGRPMALIGHSMGGLIALKVAESNPGVAAVITIACAPPRGVSFNPSWFEVSKVAWLYGLSVALGLAYRIDREDARHCLFANCHPGDFDAWYRHVALISGTSTFEMAWGKIPLSRRDIKCPILLIAGRWDRTLPMEVQQKIAALLPGATFLETEQTHAGPIQNFEGVWETLEWLEDLWR